MEHNKNKKTDKIMYNNLIYGKGNVSKQCGNDGIVSKQLEQPASHLKQKLDSHLILYRINSNSLKI